MHKERRASKACKGPKLAYKSGRGEESVEHRIALHDVSFLADAFGLGRKVQCEVYRRNNGTWDMEFLGPKLLAVLDLDEMVVSLAAVSEVFVVAVSLEIEVFAVLASEENEVSAAAVSMEIEVFVAAVSKESEVSAAAIFEEIEVFAAAVSEEKESLACAEEIASSILVRQTLVHKISALAELTLVHKIAWKAS